MKYIKLIELSVSDYENKNKWDKLLFDSTWTHRQIGTERWYMDFDNIKLAIENGANPNSCGTLTWATRMNNYEIVKYVLEHGADVDDIYDDSCKWTALMSAANSGYVEVAKLLIDYDADPFHPNFQDYTTIDVITPKRSTSNAIFGYESQSKFIQRKRNEIRRYLEENSIHLATRKYNL